MGSSMRMKSCITVILTAAALVFPIAANAMDRGQAAEFDRIMVMSADELGTLATAVLDKNYPDENWKEYRFPSFVFANEAVEAGYKIAVKRSALLAKIPCYCACDQVGHKSLLDCFLTGGKQGEYDKHASYCLACYTEAILAFLWADLGASDQEMLDGMKRRFKSR